MSHPEFSHVCLTLPFLGEFQNPFWQIVTANGTGQWSPMVWRPSVRSKGVCVTKEHHWFRTDLWPKDHPWRQKGHVLEVTVEHSAGTFSVPHGGNWDARPSTLCSAVLSSPGPHGHWPCSLLSFHVSCYLRLELTSIQRTHTPVLRENRCFSYGHHSLPLNLGTPVTPIRVALFTFKSSQYYLLLGIE